VIVDGTWALAKKLVRINPRIANLPRYSLAPDEPSRYRIRAEPRAECVSTLEATMIALGLLEGDPRRFLPMLAPFEAMIDTQIDHQLRIKSDRHKLKARKPKPRPVPSELGDLSRLVVVVGEANAWPRSQPIDRERNPPDEIVQWTAVRIGDGSVFDMIAAPQHPLAPSTPDHTRLTREQIASGVPSRELRAAWHGFIREDDVVCAWGRYATDLFASEGGAMPGAFLDLRMAVRKWLRGTPGSLEAFVERAVEVGLAPQDHGGWAPVARGRAGNRLAMSAAIARWLTSAAARRASSTPR
jgi:hypothetical protein